MKSNNQLIIYHYIVILKSKAKREVIFKPHETGVQSCVPSSNPCNCSDKKNIQNEEWLLSGKTEIPTAAEKKINF